MCPKKALTRTNSSPEALIESVLKEIQQSETPGTIVNQLPPHDFMMAHRFSDDQQRADLLAIANKEKVDLLLDLTCWPEDRPDINAIEKTLEPLTLSGLGGAIRVLSLLESGLTTLTLRRNVIVHLLDNRNDELGAAPTSEVIPFPDGMYFLEFPDPEAITDSQRAFFQALMAGPFENYQRELECIRHDMVSDLEETAYKWRNARLADFGFAPREEAIAILAPRDADQVRKTAAETETASYPLSTVLTLPVLYRENLQGNEFLDGVFGILNDLSDPERDSKINDLEVELTAMTGTFLTATGTDLGNIDAVDSGARQLRNLLALGLFETARGDLEEGAKLLLALQPAYFVQVGLGLTYPLQKRARQALEASGSISKGRIGAIFDPPHHVVLMSLSKNIPLLWTPILEGNDLVHDLLEPLDKELTAFSSELELKRVDSLLCEAETLLSLLTEGLGAKDPLPSETQASVLVMTALSNHSFERELTPTPLSLEEAHTFDQQVRETEQDEFVKGALKVLASPFGIDPEGSTDISTEEDLKRRLTLRLILIGRARLIKDVPERSLLVI